MLIGISPLIGPDLLATLCRMGHGDEIVLADAHFPGESMGTRVLRADGLKIAPLLGGILPLFALDRSADAPVIMMAPAGQDRCDPAVEQAYRNQIDRYWPDTPSIIKIDRFAFYERARKAFAVVMTGETATYANVIIKKGVTSVTD